MPLKFSSIGIQLRVVDAAYLSLQYHMVNGFISEVFELATILSSLNIHSYP